MTYVENLDELRPAAATLHRSVEVATESLLQSLAPVSATPQAEAVTTSSASSATGGGGRKNRNSELNPARIARITNESV